MRALRRTVVLVGVLVLSACGGGDDDDDGGGTGGYGTCDLRVQHSSCIEATGSPASIAEQKEGCLDANGVWSTSPCPAADDLIGCCEYTFGNSFRECVYEGTTKDPVAYCAMFDDGVWTPAGG